MVRVFLNRICGRNCFRLFIFKTLNNHLQFKDPLSVIQNKPVDQTAGLGNLEALAVIHADSLDMRNREFLLD